MRGGFKTVRDRHIMRLFRRWPALKGAFPQFRLPSRPDGKPCPENRLRIEERELEAGRAELIAACLERSA